MPALVPRLRNRASPGLYEAGEVVIRTRRLAKTYPGDVRALVEVDLSVEGGEMVALLGANGSGKTTLLRILAGRLEPTAGEAWVFGERPTASSSSARRRIGFAPQQPELDPEMTGAETLRFIAELYGVPVVEQTERYQSVISEFELSEALERPTGTYSGGQRQRLNLALALQHRPSLLLLDEPTASLDARGRKTLWRRLREFRRGGGSVVVVTHDLAGVEEHADRLLVLGAGREIVAGPSEAICRDHARTSWIVRLAAPAPDALVDRLSRLEGVAAVEQDGTELFLDAPLESELRQRVLETLGVWEDESGEAFLSLRRREADLASAFQRLTGVSAAALERGAGRGGRRGAGGGSGAGRGAGTGRGGRRG